MDKYDITKTDLIVIVMGPTGSGKSTFIDHATGGDGRDIGHSLKSTTHDIIVRKTEIGAKPFAFVDTPGFNDTIRSDYEILAEIAGFLVKAHQGGYQLNKILYLHRISDNRMAGTPLKNLELFASLCGNIAMPNVIIVTTMWSLVHDDIGDKRVQMLAGTFWKQMKEGGCHIERFDDNMDSAHMIALERGTRPNITLVTEELVNKGKPLKSTEAGIILNKQLDALLKEEKAASLQLEQLSQRQTNPEAKSHLESELQAIKKSIREKTLELQRLNRSALGSILRVFSRSQAPAIQGPSEELT
ncbi:hypothetical protein FRC15_000478 [Serendipita sp. 397]|nr:hypothetical protein FRC15_000478 [Serendipita sp. 397]